MEEESITMDPNAFLFKRRPSDLYRPDHIQRRHFLAPSPYFRWKRRLDPIAAALLLIVGLPIIGLLVLLVRLTSRGPGVYRQPRVGTKGRPFLMYKIRTMHEGAETRTGAVWAKSDDPRVTPLGRFLRASHLDELPQLFNVVKGEMSLIGPRPERPEFVRVLAQAIPDYLDRLAVPPGITGLAQINLPPDTDLNSVRRKLVFDLEYVRYAGWLLDARLSLCTLGRLVGLDLRHALRLQCKAESADMSPAAETSSKFVGGMMDPAAIAKPCTCGGAYGVCRALATMCMAYDYGNGTAKGEL
jgi:lipopolysaccharide/colanic/teichoic acid biosynthesis glycosyltransferase